jgi:hypothetical protein
MKNRVTKAWNSETAQSVYETNPISNNDKMTFRPQLIQFLAVAWPTTIRVQFTSILHDILVVDYPNQWPEFNDSILNSSHSNEISEVYAGLTMLLELTKLYRWKSAENRAGLGPVVENIFPLALQIASKLLVDTNVAAGTMLVLILKSYRSAIAVIPTYQRMLISVGITTKTSGRFHLDTLGKFISSSNCKRC